MRFWTLTRSVDVQLLKPVDGLEHPLVVGPGLGRDVEPEGTSEGSTVDFGEWIRLACVKGLAEVEVVLHRA